MPTDTDNRNRPVDRQAQSTIYPLAGKRIFVAGHRGMVGSAIVRQLAAIECEVLVADRRALDLTNGDAVRHWFDHHRPDEVILAAARVGGILENQRYPADFLYENLMIAANVIDAALRSRVEKLLFLASSAVYPKFAEQPIAESALLTGPLEPTHEGYAIAKIAGIKLVQAYRKQHGCDFIAALPTNLFGPGDNFDLNSSHVMPALIRKAHDAKMATRDRIEIWGSGSPRREFLHVDDCADACLFLMAHYSGDEHVNVGSGKDLTIYELTEKVCRAVGFTGMITRDRTKPDGPPRKLMSPDKIRAIGWSPKIELDDGLAQTYRWFLANRA